MVKAMICAVCKKKATISPTYTSAYYCETHFRALIQKRVRKDLRILKGINTKLHYYFEEDGTLLSDCAKDLLESIFEGRLQYSNDKSLPANQHIFPACLEQCVSNQFSDFLNKGDLTTKGVYPLLSVSIMDIKFLLPKEDFSQLTSDEFLSALELKQSGTHFAMANVFVFLRSLQ